MLSFVVVASLFTTIVSFDGTAERTNELQADIRQQAVVRGTKPKLRKELVSYSSSGFVYESYYLDPSCSSPAVHAKYYPVNRCMPFSETAASMYRMEEGVDGCKGAVLEVYSDTTCINLESTTDFDDWILECQAQSPGYYGFGENPFYRKLSCTSYVTPKLDHQSVVEALYEGSTECDVGGSIEDYRTYSTDWCMLTDGGKAQQFQCADDGMIWTNVYPSQVCLGSHESYSNLFVGQCQSLANNGSVVRYCANANAPTARPTTTPGPQTFQVEFNVRQVFSGVSYNKYMAQSYYCDPAFKQAIAASMAGATTAAVFQLTVTGTSVQPAAAHGTLRTLLRPLLALFEAEAAYPLYVSYQVLYFAPSSTAEVISKLTYAFATGEFDATLYDTANQLGASALFDAKVTDYSVTESGDADDSEVLSLGAIVGIAIGGVVVIALICYGVFACTRQPQAVAYETVKPSAPPALSPAAAVAVEPVEFAVAAVHMDSYEAPVGGDIELK